MKWAKKCGGKWKKWGEKLYKNYILFMILKKKKQKQRLKQNLDALLYIEATTTHKEVSNISKSRYKISKL